jgi:glycosyltransferase involved in cell wall biosynthesis
LSTRPEVSVVIPTRDRWHRLSRTLACVRRQQGVTLQIVVVDDGSADGTAERVRALGDARILVVRHERSLGLAGARNAGIRAATGDWIAFLDDDDLWSEAKLARQLRAARRARADWCYAGAAFVDERGGLLGLAEPPDPDWVP